MKKLFYFLLFCALAVTSVSAQSFKVGAGAAYGTDISSIGISANAVYDINKQWEAAGSFIFFFEKDLVSWKALNANVHYIFSENENMRFYGIGGMNLTFYTIDLPSTTFGGTTIGGEQSGSNFGVNIGAGTIKNLNEKLEIFGEAQYTLSDGSYLTANIGILVKL